MDSITAIDSVAVAQQYQQYITILTIFGMTVFSLFIVATILTIWLYRKYPTIMSVGLTKKDYEDNETLV